MGGNLTPIGSASTVIAVTIMAKNNLTMGFGRFLKMALPFALLQLALTTGYLLIVL